jgi:tetratricopeptide (TPR) repeat protein
MVQIAPADANAHNNLGFIFLVIGDIEKAFLSLKRCIDLDAKFARAYYNLGACHVARENDAQGIIEYKKGIELGAREMREHIDDLEIIIRLHPEWKWVEQIKSFLVHASN